VHFKQKLLLKVVKNPDCSSITANRKQHKQKKSIMKRLTRIVIIGCLHTSMYLFILPKLILPQFDGETKTIVRFIVSALTIALTIAIIRIPKYLSKRAKRKLQ